MTEKEKPKQSIQEVLAGFMGDDENTPVDVAMELLNPKNAVMHTDIKSIPLMNKLAILIETADSEEEAAFFQKLYDVNILHPVSEKRKRESAIAGMFASLQNWYMMQTTGQQQQQGKTGLFGRKK